MSDPREFERDPSLSGNRYVGRESGSSQSSAWIVGGVIVAILLGLAAYSLNGGGTQMTSSGTPETTSGQSTRAPVPKTPPAAPVTAPAAPAVPAQPRQ
jgi:hypothetical protein